MSAPAATGLGALEHCCRLLTRPAGASLCFVDRASPRGAAPSLLSLDLMDYGVRKWANASLSCGVVVCTAPWVFAIALPMRVHRSAVGVRFVALLPLAAASGVAAGCVLGVVALVVRGLDASFGAAAALMGAACFPLDVTGRALEQLASRCD